MISAVILLFILVKQEDVIERYITAICLWTLLCFVMTEGLSVFEWITPKRVCFCWGICVVILLAINLLIYKRRIFHEIICIRDSLIVNRLTVVWGVFAIIMLFLAIKTIPYNYDSMTYHLPRIYHWLDNRTVAHYATHIDRQVASPVLGDFINLHVYAMGNGNDTLINLMQCCSYLTNGILVYHIARKLECSRRYCVLSSILFYSMRIAFAEAMTTQVDNLTTLWMLCFVYLLMDLLNVEEKIVWDKRSVRKVMLLSCYMVFGYLTKPSVGIGMLFFALWLLIVVIKRKDNTWTIIRCILLASGIMLILSMPEIARNIKTFEHFSAPVAGKRQLIGTLSPLYVLVNFLKNITFNLPNSWFPQCSAWIYIFITSVSRFLGVVIDDPSISEDGRAFRVGEADFYGHDTAVNPVITWLFLACILLFCCNNKNKSRHMSKYIFLTSSVGFIFFCAILRWEPYVSRYMISYLAVLCPAISTQLEMFMFNRKRGARYKEIAVFSIICFLCIMEVFGALLFHGKIAFADEGYFTHRETEIAEAYYDVIDIIKDNEYERIGLIVGYDSCEYPLLALIDDDVEIEHVNVNNATIIYEDKDFVPDAILTIEYTEDTEMIECHNVEYTISGRFNNDMILYEKKR